MAETLPFDVRNGRRALGDPPPKRGRKRGNQNSFSGILRNRGVTVGPFVVRPRKQKFGNRSHIIIEGKMKF